jgi:hypothetical protein
MMTPIHLEPKKGWTAHEIGGQTWLFLETEMGLQATFTRESYAKGAPASPMASGGNFKHLVLARRDRYPSFQEMKEFIKGCILLNRRRSVFMFIPPEDGMWPLKRPSFAFHWFQQQACPHPTRKRRCG